MVQDVHDGLTQGAARSVPTAQDQERSGQAPAPPAWAGGKEDRAAYHADSALLAQAQLQALARELDKTHPRVAASLREGLAETLTVLRLGVPPTLARTFRSTNANGVHDRGL